MRPIDLINLEIKVGSTWTDFSDGIIDIGIIRGIQGYEYIWQQPESGILTLISRNSNLDPYVNENVRSGKEIRIKTDTDNIFTGRISEINVDYQPKGKPPKITLIAVDMIGTMALHTLRDGFTERLGGSMDIFGMFQELVDTSGSNPLTPPSEYEIIGFTNPFRESGLVAPPSAANVTSSGSTALSVASTLSSGGIQFFFADKNNDVYLYNRMNKKKDEEIKVTFDSRGGATSYRQIELTDNFDVLTNQLSIRNKAFNSDIVPLYQNAYSVSEWGPARKEFTTQLGMDLDVQTPTTNAIKDVIFQDAAHPSKEIDYITWDGTLNPEIASNIDILDNVFIYHEVDPEDIERKYGVIGIEHRITADDWDIKYYLKNHFVYDTNFPTPTVTSDHPLGGTINDNITLSISNINDIDTTNATYSWKYAAGTTGNTVGLEFSTDESPVLDYALANVGTKFITCTLTDSYGFVKTSEPYELEIYGAAPTAVTISYTINPNDSSIYTFTATTTEATSYTFHWGDSTTYTTTNNLATHRYETSGNKSVYVVASNAFGSTTSATTDIDVVVPPAPEVEVGTFPLRYVALSARAQNISTGGTLIPYWSRLQLNTSNWASGDPTTDSAINRALIGSYEKTVNKTPNLPAVGISQIVNWTKINNQTGNVGGTDWTRFYMPTSGLFNATIIFDLSAPFYDIDDIKMSFFNVSTTQTASQIVDVYITDSIDDVFDFDNVYWWKLGTINSGVINPSQIKQFSMVLEPYITSMPLDAKPFTLWTYSVGNSAPNIIGDQYTFTTDDFMTVSYLWDFGDGNTSTLQNPVHNYATSGSKTVTLTKYDEYGNGYQSSQTFTVNRQQDETGTFGVRYIKLKQNTFNATALRYSPLIGDFEAKTSATAQDRLFNRSITSVPVKTNLDFWDEGGPSSDTLITMTSSSPFLGTLNGYNVYPRNSLTIGTNNQASWYASGAEPRATTTGNTSFELVWDLGTLYYDIKEINFAGNRNGVGTSTSVKPTYEVYFSSDNTTWTKVADITFSGVSMSNSGVGGWYEANVNPTTTLPLNL